MNLTDEQLALIEDYASNFMTWREIAVLLEIDQQELRELLSDLKSPAYLRYKKGKTKSVYEINKYLVKLAKLGSPQAGILVKNDINRQEDAEDDL
jgi:predicted transcriptional regulator of viral defense system